jgi:hypothetical protein
MNLPCISEHHFRLISSATGVFFIICIYHFRKTGRPLLRTWQTSGPEIYTLLQTAARYPVANYSWYRREEIRPLIMSLVLCEKMQRDALFELVLLLTMYGNSLDAMQCNVLTKTYLVETPYRRPCQSRSRTPCADTHRLSIQDGLTHRCVCRYLKSADFTSVTNVGNASDCWIQNVLVNLRTREPLSLFLQLFWIFRIPNDYEQWLIFLWMQFQTTV